MPTTHQTGASSSRHQVEQQGASPNVVGPSTDQLDSMRKKTRKKSLPPSLLSKRSEGKQSGWETLGKRGSLSSSTSSLVKDFILMEAAATSSSTSANRGRSLKKKHSLHFGSLPPEIQDDVTFLEAWLDSMELRLPPLPPTSSALTSWNSDKASSQTSSTKVSRKDIAIKMKELKAAHQEIKSHGQTIKSIVSICEQFSSSCSSSSSVSKRSQFYGKGPPQRQSSLVVTPGGDNFSNNNNNCLRGEDVGRSIERRWHCLWLRSLEWQCYLEQLTWTPNIKKKQKQQPLPPTQVPISSAAARTSQTAVSSPSTSDTEPVDKVGPSSSGGENRKKCHIKQDSRQTTDLRLDAGYTIEAQLQSKSNANKSSDTKGSFDVVDGVKGGGALDVETPNKSPGGGDANVGVVRLRSKKRRKERGVRSKSLYEVPSVYRQDNTCKTSLPAMMNTSFCSSESSSSLTSASMTSSMTSSNSQDAGSHSTIDKAVPMSTSNSMHADLETGGGDGPGLNSRAKSQLLSDHGKDSGDSSAAEEQKSLTSLNREMRMLIRLATATPTDPLTAKYNGNNVPIHENDNSLAHSSPKCQTTYSRKQPNCGTYFFKHVSSSEDECVGGSTDNALNNNNNNNGGEVSVAGSSTIMSSSSPTPRPEDSSDIFQSSPLVLTSSPLKTSDSEIPLFEDDELQELDDEDLDILIEQESMAIMSRGSSDAEKQPGYQQRAKISSIESSDGRKIPVLDFSGLHDEDETLEGSHPEVSVSPDSKEKQDLEVFRKNSIKKLVGDAEKLLFQTVSFSTTDDSDGGGHTQSASELSRKCGKSKRLRSSGFNCGYKRSHSFHNYGAAVLAEASEDPASQTLPAKPSGFDASGESTEISSSSEDEDMKSQHNQSAYSLVLVDDISSTSASPVANSALPPTANSTEPPDTGVEQGEPKGTSAPSPDKQNNDSTLKAASTDINPPQNSKQMKIRLTPPKKLSPNKRSSKKISPSPRSSASGACTASAEEEEFWDQETRYLSEHNYDEPIDVARAMKLLNFGDDCRNYIGSGSEFGGSDLTGGGSVYSPRNAMLVPSSLHSQNKNPTAVQTAGNNQLNKSGSSASGKQRRKRRSINQNRSGGASGNGGASLNNYDSMSETEMDDVWRTVLESRTKLNEVKRRFRNCQAGGRSRDHSHVVIDDDDDVSDNNESDGKANESSSSGPGLDTDPDFTSELNDLKDICRENVDCIFKLLEDNTEKNGTVVLKKTERSFKGLLRQWQDVMHLITKRLELTQTLTKIMADIKRLEEDVGKVLMGRPPPPVMHNKEDLQKDIDGLKGSVVHLTGLKSDLFNVNVEIHNFLADLCVTRRQDSAHSPPQQRIPILRRETITSTSLRDKVVALYALWDEAFHRISSQLANSQSVFAKLLQFESESHRLAQIMEQTQLLKRTKRHSSCLTEDSGISEGGSENNEKEEALLTKLKALAQDLESKLTPQSSIVQEITQTLKSSASGLEETGRLSRLSSIMEPEKRLDSVTRGTCTDDDQFTTTSTSIQESPASVCEADTATPVPPPRRGFWRKMMRATVPIQAVFLSSIIMSWVLDPENSMSGGCNGGDMMMSALYPQLRYLNGPPPI